MTQALQLMVPRTVLYAAFAGICLLLSLFITFPYEAIQQRIEIEAARAGLSVKLGSLGPALFGVTASRVQIGPAVEGDAAQETLLIPEIVVRPTLFPLGVRFKAKAFGGSLEGSTGQGSKAEINLHFEGLDLSQGNLQALSGVDLSGKLSGHLALTLPVAAPPGAKAKVADLSQADGQITLDAAGLLVNGGTVKVPMYGSLAPMDLPKVALGNLELRLNFDKGLGTIESLKTSGGDLDLNATGTLKLARKLDYSEPNVDIKLRASPEMVKRLGILGSGLSLLPSDRSDPSTKSAHLSGYLGKPRFAPGAKN